MDFPLGSFSANLHFSLIWIKIYKIYKMIKSLTIWRNFTFMFHGQQTSEISRTFLSATLGINYYKGIFKPSSFAFLTLNCCRKEIVTLCFSFNCPVLQFWIKSSFVILSKSKLLSFQLSAKKYVTKERSQCFLLKIKTMKPFWIY